MKYAKIQETGILDYAPTDYNGISNWINDEQAVLAEGYCPVIEEQPPKGMVFKEWTLEDNKIVPVFELNYIAQRRAEYPDIAEQLDMIYWDKQYGTNIWETTISAIKEKYPKP